MFFFFLGAGYREHIHTWSICPQIYTDINGYCTSKPPRKKIRIYQPLVFFCSACKSIFTFLFTCQTRVFFCDSFNSLHFLFLQVNDNPDITPKKCEQLQGWNIKALLSLHRAVHCSCPSADFSSKVSCVFFLSRWFALKFHLEQVRDLHGPVQVSQETTGNFSEHFHPCKYLQG